MRKNLNEENQSRLIFKQFDMDFYVQSSSDISVKIWWREKIVFICMSEIVLI